MKFLKVMEYKQYLFLIFIVVIIIIIKKLTTTFKKLLKKKKKKILYFKYFKRSLLRSPRLHTIIYIFKKKKNNNYLTQILIVWILFTFVLYIFLDVKKFWELNILNPLKRALRCLLCVKDCEYENYEVVMWCP